MRAPRGRILPLRVAVVEDEGLDSWLQALALRNGLSLGQILTEFGHPQVRLTRTLLIEPPNAFLREVEARTGLSTGRLESTVLDPCIPLGPKRARGSRYCPRCLAERQGRWKLRWWLPFSFACTSHRTLLHDVCPGCQMLARHRLPITTAPATICTQRDRGGPLCGTDLTGTEVVILETDDPVLAAQRWIDEHSRERERLGSTQVLTDLYACTPWLLRRLTRSDAARVSPPLARDWHAWSTSITRGPRRQEPAAVTAVAVHHLRLMLADDTADAIAFLRALFTRDTAATIRPGDMGQTHWKAFSPRLHNRFLRAADTRLGNTDRLRYYSCTPIARLPERTHDQLVAERARRIPQMLWPQWTMQLLPRHGADVDLFRALACALLLIPGQAQRSVRPALDLLNPRLRSHSPTLQTMVVHGGDDVLAALCALADYLDTYGGPIDYQRRRDTISDTVLFSYGRWWMLCFDAGTHPGKPGPKGAPSARYRHALRYLYQLLTGSDLATSSHPLSWKGPADRSRYLHFEFTLTSRERDLLNQHAQNTLAHLGIDEPLTWSPPAQCCDHLCLPGPELADIDLEALRRLVLEEQRQPGQVAEELGTTLAHVRFALPLLDRAAPPLRRNSPAQAWRERQHAAKILTAEFFHREYVGSGKPLRELAMQTGLSRPVVAAFAKAHGVELRRAPPSVPIDAGWLREQYVVAQRSATDIARELGIEDMTVLNRLALLGVPVRPAGVHSRHEMIRKLPPHIPLNIRRAVEGGLHGWHRLARFQLAMDFDRLTTAAEHLGIVPETLSRQFARLETDIGARLYHRSTLHDPMRCTSRGARLLRDLDRPDVQSIAPAEKFTIHLRIKKSLITHNRS